MIQRSCSLEFNQMEKQNQTDVYIKTCTQIFIAALFILVKNLEATKASFGM